MTFFNSGKSLHPSLRIIICLLVLAVLSFAAQADASIATLYKGNQALGLVPAEDGKNGFVISVADAGALLGLAPSVVGEELVLTKGGDSLRIVLNAVAAWYNNQLIPLYGASYVNEGRWWLDVPSSLSLLQYFAGRGSGDRLRVEETAGTQTAESPAKAVTESAPPAVTAPVVPSVPAQSAADKVTPVPQPIKKTSAPPPAVVPASVPSTSTISEIRSTQAVSGAPGELRGVRWSVSKEKIRAVLDCSDETNPDVKLVSGKIAVPFSAAADDLQGVPSPYENVKAELTRDAKGAATLFFSAAGVRVEKLVLSEPRRIVFDFVFNAPTTVRETPQSQAQQAVPGASVKTAPVRTGKKLVVLDPGHGGNDPGAVGNGLREKDINLAVGLKMEKALLNKGFNVKMTRKTDVYLKLQERTDIANKADADMFVSIHVNSLPPGKTSAAGFEIYLMALPTDKDALALAKIENREYMEDKSGGGATADRRTELLLTILGDMQQNNKINESTVAAEVLFRAGNNSALPMRRLAQAPFFVLRGAGMPAVLLEMGFISNATEAKLLAHSGYQQKIADAMTEGISNYLK